MKTQLLIKINEALNQGSNGTVKTFENIASKFIINAGAGDDEIIACDSYFHNKIPKDYKSFLKIFNGCTFFKIEDFAGYKFYGCNDLIRENKFQKENLGEYWDENIILICSCLGDGDYLGVRIFDDNSYEIVDCFVEELPSNWKSISNSFDDFLEKLIDERGKKFWLDSPS